MSASESWSGPNPETIQSMFSRISGRYDLANTVLSGGLHHLWRRSLVRWSNVGAGHSVLDCATGTGDLAFAYKKAVGPSGDVVATDFCTDMLVPARQKAEKYGYKMTFAQADVLNLEYPSNHFDRASISFGIRNVEDPSRALFEMARVVRPGGFVMVLEFGQPQLNLLADLYRFYSNRVLPRIGGLVTGDTEAYRYLQTSSAAFPYAEDFKQFTRPIKKIRSVEYYPLSFGIAYMYRLSVGTDS